MSEVPLYTFAKHFLKYAVHTQGAVALPNKLPLLDPCFFSAEGKVDLGKSGHASAKVDKFVYFRRLVEWLLKLSGVEVRPLPIIYISLPLIYMIYIPLPMYATYP